MRGYARRSRCPAVLLTTCSVNVSKEMVTVPPPTYSTNDCYRETLPSYSVTSTLFPGLRPDNKHPDLIDIEAAAFGPDQIPAASANSGGRARLVRRTNRPRCCRQTLCVIVAEVIGAVLISLFTIHMVLSHFQGATYAYYHPGMVPAWYGNGWICPKEIRPGVWEGCRS